MTVKCTQQNLILAVVVSGLTLSNLQAERISHAFELRSFSHDARADGESDFKGPTATFSTEDRLEFLRVYARYARDFFGDPNLDKLVVTDAEARNALRAIKPQPLPVIRRRIPLEEWKWVGSRPGQRADESRRLAEWKHRSGVGITRGELQFTADQSLPWTFAAQPWRMFLQWRARMPTANRRADFSLSGVVETGFAANGSIYHRTAEGEVAIGTYRPGRWTEFKAEIDLESGRYNLYIDGDRRVDFLPVLANRPVDALRIAGVKGLAIDDVWGVGYLPIIEKNPANRGVPYSIKTYVDERFDIRPDIDGWMRANYDDSGWATTTLPYAHGGERFAGEDLYLRKTVSLPAFTRAVLNVEAIDPEGEIWINGEVVLVPQARHPISLDVTRFLKPEQVNLIAFRVRANKVKHTIVHSPADPDTGWFAGRTWLDLTGLRHIDDVFAYAQSVSDPATLHIEADVHNDDWEIEEREMKNLRLFKGAIVTEVYPWFPAESSEPAAVARAPIEVRLEQTVRVKQDVAIPHPRLWTPERPQLYKVVVRLVDDTGTPVDDYALTTGLRTISQDGGTFRLNGQPAMLNGPLLMPHRAPLDKIATWMRCSPAEWLIKDILMIKRMNGNGARMSHHNGPEGGINDPRYPEFADQLGLMFEWGTTAWLRTGSPWMLDFEGLPLYVRQVRNHPSIVMWQQANHPLYRSFEEGMEWLERVYGIVYPLDPSRLISPPASQSRLKTRNDAGTLDESGKPVEPIAIWTAPMVTRGNMEVTTGYGAEWITLRKWPQAKNWTGEHNWITPAHRADMLASPARAYFDFENEESIGQPNWSLHRGKPEYRIMSYELDYDVGSIGRRLTTDEWQESQAWQAFSGYEAYRKKRWLDYDGLNWCSLGGGPNTVTYQKPLTDYWGEAKLAFYTLRMALQPVLAGSRNIDVVYGPNDSIPIVVLNLGAARRVDVVVTVKTPDGAPVGERRYPGVNLPAGRTTTDLPAWQPALPKPGYYVIEYDVADAGT